MLGNLGAFESFDQYVQTSTSSETPFPVIPITATVKVPDRIFLQAATTNNSSIFIGKPGLQTDGSTGAFVLVPGSNSMIPFSIYKDLVHKSAGSQILYITYLSNGFN